MNENKFEGGLVIGSLPGSVLTLYFLKINIICFI